MILVTGANGLLGRSLVQRLVSSNEVHAIVRVLPENPIRRVNYHAIDLGSDWSTEQLPGNIESIIHLAQSSHFREFPEQAKDVFRVNVESTFRLLDYARRTGVRQFINASSGGVYGSGKRAFDENSPIVPPGQLGYYLGSKLCSEVLVQSYAAHMQIVILRYFFIYGPNQDRSMLVPRLIDNIKNQRPIPLLGEHGIRINPIYVNDAVHATIAALDSGNSATFNVSGPDVLSLREICEIAGEQMKVEPIFELQDGRQRDLIGDNAAMLKQLWVPQVHFPEGIRQLLK
jgi:UDP-glucose 4-epimerase